MLVSMLLVSDHVCQHQRRLAGGRVVKRNRTNATDVSKRPAPTFVLRDVPSCVCVYR